MKDVELKSEQMKTTNHNLHSTKILKDQLIGFLQEENAHANMDTVLKDLPEKLIGLKLPNLPYTIWQLTEHIRITQWDIVEFSERDGKHVSPDWPDEYWPKSNAPLNIKEWDKTIHAISKDRERMVKLIKDPQSDLFRPFSFGQGQTLFREALLIMDHTSYHLGEIIVLRRLMNAWD
jgi:hypothetical protein